MTNDNKPPMFGPSASFDPATHEPRSGKSALMNPMVAELSGKPPALAETIIGNCTTSIPFKFDSKNNGHTMIFAPTRAGMSADYSALALTERGSQGEIHQQRRDSISRKLCGRSTAVNVADLTCAGNTASKRRKPHCLTSQ